MSTKFIVSIVETRSAPNHVGSRNAELVIMTRICDSVEVARIRNSMIVTRVCQVMNVTGISNRVTVLLIGVTLSRTECTTWIISSRTLGASVVPTANELTAKVWNTEGASGISARSKG